MIDQPRGRDFNVQLPAALRTHIEMAADQFGVPFDHAVVMLVAMGLACRANHDQGIDEQIAASELLASFSGGGEEERLKRISPPTRH
ncbi:hypothetical protein [Jiangella rhizosphaerae]|uniref:Toxin-antitoxin system HicB family antitoxin n=1 Tax=Jiangella rhizosphaerae TaxID=2293569 RepID=A0A418KT08_9ACTN|nr:hypothetical protein [Jiangella rhizosphaerae]RIQ29138.1 hypothetical protein DY240_08730 [Jiangella rhizosphaerae]